MLTAEVAAQRVALGMSFLDKAYPGWEDRIHLPTLRMQSCSHCVLGQLEEPDGNYDSAYNRHALYESESIIVVFGGLLTLQSRAAAYGLTVRLGDYDPTSSEFDPFWLLREAWVAAITTRRDAKRATLTPIEEGELVPA